LTIIHSDIAGGLEPGSDLTHAFLDIPIQYWWTQNTPPAYNEAHETFKITVGRNGLIRQAIEAQKSEIDEFYPQIAI
jgi:hypothetical protein